MHGDFLTSETHFTSISRE